ncbi:hypothetical protein [Parasphingorhabdus sp.]|uniref:hypothetical protein n=1 Tax=Parasphingorhabdus sp. TaxID=2709688 RepID=UPI003266E7A5
MGKDAELSEVVQTLYQVLEKLDEFNMHAPAIKIVETIEMLEPSEPRTESDQLS